MAQAQQDQQDQQDQQEGIRCLIVPLTNVNLLVPGTVVAEVAGYPEPTAVTGLESSPWLLGTANWRGMRLPVASVEGLIDGSAVSRPGVRARLLVLKALSGHPRLPFYGIVAKQIPRLVNVAPGMIEALQDDALADAPGEVVLAAGEPAVLLDVDTVERRIIEALYQ